MFLTIFTPTFNRSRLISRVYQSLRGQVYKDFEWIVIDDGSEDDTEAVIDNFRREADFDVIYIKQENRGKVASINRALSLARGDFFLVFDSDDWCTEDAILRFKEEWLRIPESEKNRYAAISSLKAYRNGDVVGEEYLRISKYGASYVDRYNLRILGDKWELIRTDVHREHMYDIEAGERYMPPEYAWLLIGLRWLTVFVNEPLSVVEYQEDGISRNNIVHRAASPISTMRFYSLARSCSHSKAMRFRATVNLLRFGLHVGRLQSKVTTNPLAILTACCLYMKDKVVLHMRWRRNQRLGC